MAGPEDKTVPAVDISDDTETVLDESDELGDIDTADGVAIREIDDEGQIADVEESYDEMYEEITTKEDEEDA